MVISRLRLRLAGGSALVLGTALGLLVVAGIVQQSRESRRRFDARLDAVVAAAERALRLQLRDEPGGTLRSAAAEVARQWPHGSDSFVMLDSAGATLAALDTRGFAPRVLAARRSAMDRFDVDRDGNDARATRRWTTVHVAGATDRRVEIIAFDSTEGLERDTEFLAGALLITVPVLILLSLAGGYLLADRALDPMRRLGDEIDRIAPDDIAARLPIAPEADEVTALAHRVNTLMGRLEVSRRSHQRFVRQAAHQIRTPLTLILGEATHALGTAPAETGGPTRALERVRAAADQMRRRVDELLLFEEAESGVEFARDESVELDELALECTDLMRGRAADLGRSLALGHLAPVAVRGNLALLREALLEMLENACRHGGAAQPVTVGAEACDDEAHIVVRSALGAVPAADGRGRGLGTPILEWIAAGHDGRFERSSIGDIHEARLVLRTG